MRVSVVMSTYNDAAHLPASIESVLSQDLADFEFIIVNDGSPDPRTAGILADYARRDPRVRVITKQNEGLTKALIEGCAAARGEYLARIDVGDTMTPDRLRRQSEVLDRHPEVVFVSCWTEFCGPEWEHLWIEKGTQPAKNANGREGGGRLSERREATLGCGLRALGSDCRSPSRCSGESAPAPGSAPPAPRCGHLPEPASAPDLQPLLHSALPAPNSAPPAAWIADVLPDHPGENLKAGPTSHPSVMMRTEAYHEAGGYRWQFYYGQDWDLWYRLAELGRFAMIPDVLYRVRVMPLGISASHHQRQMAIGQCSLDAFARRRQGLREDDILALAAAIRPNKGKPRRNVRQCLANGYYFVGETLRRNADPRCRRYLWLAFRADPLHLRCVLRLAQSLVLLRERLDARS